MLKQDIQFLLDSGAGSIYTRLDLFFKQYSFNDKGKYKPSGQFTKRWDDVIDQIYRTQFRLHKEYKSFVLLTDEEAKNLLEEAIRGLV